MPAPFRTPRAGSEAGSPAAPPKRPSASVSVNVCMSVYGCVCVKESRFGCVHLCGNSAANHSGFAAATEFKFIARNNLVRKGAKSGPRSGLQTRTSPKSAAKSLQVQVGMRPFRPDAAHSASHSKSRFCDSDPSRLCVCVCVCWGGWVCGCVGVCGWVGGWVGVWVCVCALHLRWRSNPSLVVTVARPIRGRAGSAGLVRRTRLRV